MTRQFIGSSNFYFAGANHAASCWLGLFLPREGIVDLGEIKDLAVAIAMPLSSHPSFYVLLSMDSIAMARSMVKAVGEIYFSLYYSFVTSTLFLDSIFFRM